MTVVAHFHSVLKIDIRTMKKACKAHLSILDAIEKDDEPRAQAEMEKDILDIYRAYKRTEETH